MKITQMTLQHPAVAGIWRCLRQIPDPELPLLSITELGMIRAVNAAPAGWQVVLTPTYSGCPATRFLQDDIRQRLQQAGYPSAEVVVSLHPAWSSDWISETGRRKLLEAGIAPPHRCAAATICPVACPRCGSLHTEQISEFGSTACKALYRCCACREPFDYFKCL
ncbi:phenylacetate-CoA oxygenase subunit PaaJ [Erwinia sp. E602]|uniref:1,2-phenylacetyl-CoA epoxidase subunit PaaD n=1 Tax=unclassified Erwinia TaxID=2622719 RepID=UPI0006FEAC94|nr:MULTISPECIES: 1,2-phenylacetyl-CoA epoxidase subunit PaaD [unclassified Erwinia]KQN55122.1 phenylacetate-CoA oxygenase subunit PaaJ [Erwinia sp. Leaf53]PLV63427.1 phenylacetic acid degradation protein [Erwinia sp. B116]QUG75004.1 phenylacetate-CoA oxygenase subunit PaaJ [Erwinia sp. E602]